MWDSENRRGAGSFLTFLLLIGLSLCILLYIAWNEPLKRALLNLRPLAYALLFLAAFTGWGTVFRRLSTGHDLTIQILTATALGTGLTSLMVFALGLAGMLPAKVYWMWLAGGLILLARAARYWRFPVRPDRPRTSWDTLATGILFLFIGSMIPFVVAPETTTDALEYHLLIPKLYMSMGKIGFIPLLLESNYPSLAEYIFLFILPLAGDTACKCLHFWFGVLVLILIRVLTKKISPSSEGILSSALFISMPVALVVFGWSWNDMIQTFFFLLSLYYVLRFRIAEGDTRSSRDLLLAGLTAGLGSWTKYTFVIFLLVLMLVSLQGLRRWKWSHAHVAILFAPIVFFCALWGIKNWIFTGNPVFPFLNQVFQSPHITPAAAEYFRDTLTRYEFPEWKWYTSALYPFVATLKPNIVDVHPGVLLLFLIALLFRKNASSGTRFLKLFVGLYIAVWLLMQTLIRSLFPVLAVISVIGGAALEEIRWPSRVLQSTLQRLILISVACHFVISMVSTYYIFDPVKYFLGRETRAQYLTRMSKSQPVYDYLNFRPEVGKVALIGLHNPFYLQKPFLFSSCCDTPLAEALTAQASTPQELAARLHNLGVTHIVVDSREYQREHREGLFSWNPAERKRFETFLQEYCNPVIQFGFDRVHVLNPAAAPSATRLSPSE